MLKNVSTSFEKIHFFFFLLVKVPSNSSNRWLLATDIPRKVGSLGKIYSYMMNE